jgi:hypothetical protein
LIPWKLQHCPITNQEYETTTLECYILSSSFSQLDTRTSHFHWPKCQDIVPLTVLSPPHFCACPKTGLDFQPHMSWSFIMFNEARRDCSFCCYWWNWWQPLFTFSFHKKPRTSMIFLIATWYVYLFTLL